MRICCSISASPSRGPRRRRTPGPGGNGSACLPRVPVPVPVPLIDRAGGLRRAFGSAQHDRSWLKGAGDSARLAAESATPTTRQLFLHGGIERRRRRSRPGSAWCLLVRFRPDAGGLQLRNGRDGARGIGRGCGPAVSALRRTASRRFYSTRAWYPCPESCMTTDRLLCAARHRGMWVFFFLLSVSHCMMLMEVS